MNLKSKYNIGDKVVRIDEIRQSIFIPCKACEGTGTYFLNDSIERKCPECFGNKGKVEWAGTHNWIIMKKDLTIGLIRIEANGNNIKCQYMCEETGIGTGSIWKEEELFLSVEMAEKECKKLNKGKKNANP